MFSGFKESSCHMEKETQQGPTALNPAACQELNDANNHISLAADPSPAQPHIRQLP